MERPNQSKALNLLPDILKECQQDSAGMYEVGEAHLGLLEQWLHEEQLVISEPDAVRIKDGIALAQQLESAGTLEDRLSSFEFLSESVCKRMIGDSPVVNIWLAKPLFADPDKILGAESFSSWMGRGDYGQGEVAIRDRAGKRSSYEQIVDYATRESRLPSLGADGGLNLIIDNERMFFFSSNSHRAAAAKLRNEPLGFRRLSVFQTQP